MRNLFSHDGAWLVKALILVSVLAFGYSKLCVLAGDMISKAASGQF